MKGGDWSYKRVGYVEDFSNKSLLIVENILDKKTDMLAWKLNFMCVQVNGIDVPYLDFVEKCK
jgi:hypothetical protein